MFPVRVCRHHTSSRKDIINVFDKWQFYNNGGVQGRSVRFSRWIFKTMAKRRFYKQRARRLPLRRANTVITSSMSMSLCLWLCKIPFFFSLFPVVWPTQIFPFSKKKCYPEGNDTLFQTILTLIWNVSNAFCQEPITHIATTLAL